MRGARLRGKKGGWAEGRARGGIDGQRGQEWRRGRWRAAPSCCRRSAAGMQHHQKSPGTRCRRAAAPQITVTAAARRGAPPLLLVRAARSSEGRRAPLEHPEPQSRVSSEVANRGRGPSTSVYFFSRRKGPHARQSTMTHQEATEDRTGAGEEAREEVVARAATRAHAEVLQATALPKQGCQRHPDAPGRWAGGRAPRPKKKKEKKKKAKMCVCVCYMAYCTLTCWGSGPLTMREEGRDNLTCMDNHEKSLLCLCLCHYRGNAR